MNNNSSNKSRNGYFNQRKRIVKELIVTGLGSFIGIGAVAFLSCQFELPLLIASFGASAVLLYGAYESPLSQPRNVLGGHVLSAFVGTTCYQLMGDAWYSITIAVTLTILLMTVTKTLHPPGGATALVCVMQHSSYFFIFMPVFIGALILIVVAVLVNRISPERQYPKKS